MSKAALITGASSGIGEQFAESLAKKGMNLVLTARNKTSLQQLADQLSKTYHIKTTVITADLSKEYASNIIVNELKEKEIHIDMLINNAGFGTTGEFISNEMEKDHEQVMVNVTAVVDLTHLLLPAMVQKGEGTIINVASVVAFQPVPIMSVYAATKAFVLSFSESLWAEYKKKGIQVTAICPGSTKTNFFTSVGDPTPKHSRTPLQVVNAALAAVEKGKPVVVDGAKNVLLTVSPRFLPRKLVTIISGKIAKSQKKK
ncbi:SDR family NAD(P)-dependent oxidoreductase [Longirhabdus pacifica]|uniref:SDR family NAD(P)-dependent oxidoreductase n=1 Tax=Longirhabdus pacifica TaxID=2305227 RepID=UPI001008C0E4|nr:SDR family oxidoreductase [Longirhabdus pacifica]